MKKPKLTQNQAEFAKEIARINRLLKKAEKQGITFEKPIIEKPTHVTKQKIAEAKSITFAKLKELAQPKTLKIDDEGPKYRRHEPEDIYIRHPRFKKPDEPKLTPEELAEIRRRNLEKARLAQMGKPRSQAQIDAAKANIKKAQEAQQGKPRTQKQIEAARANAQKMGLARTGKPMSEAQKAAARENIKKAQAARKGKPMTEKQRDALKKAAAARKGKPLSEKQKAAARENIRKAQAARKGKPISEKQREALRKAGIARRGKPLSPKQLEAARRNIAKARQAKADKAAGITPKKDWKAAPSGDLVNGDYTPFPEPMLSDQAESVQISHIIDLLKRKITPESATAILKVLEAVQEIGARKIIENYNNHTESNDKIDEVCFDSDEEDRKEALKDLINIIYDNNTPDDIKEFLGEIDDYIYDRFFAARLDAEDPLMKHYLRYKHENPDV